MSRRFKTIEGAVRRIRQLEKQKEVLDTLLEEYARDRKQLAMLAAKGPCFFNPLVAMEAQTLRDEILKDMGMNPDGTFIPKGPR